MNLNSARKNETLKTKAKLQPQKVKYGGLVENPQAM